MNEGPDADERCHPLGERSRAPIADVRINPRERPGREPLPRMAYFTRSVLAGRQAGDVMPNSN
jgi:hypothetical protein